MRLLHAVASLKKLRWLAQTKVISLKTQLHAVNAWVKRSSQRSFSLQSDLGAKHAQFDQDFLQN